MSELTTWFNENNLTMEEIKGIGQEDAESTVLVNVNRIYSIMSEMIRKKADREYLNLLSDVISNIYDEKEMYTVMKAIDVVKCFDHKNEKYPLNTFLKNKS